MMVYLVSISGGEDEAWLWPGSTNAEAKGINLSWPRVDSHFRLG